MAMKGKLGRMRVRAGRLQRHSFAALEEAWAAEAVARLSDRELALLDGALDRGFDPQRERQDILVSPAEQAAYRMFREFYEEARRGR